MKLLSTSSQQASKQNTEIRDDLRRSSKGGQQPDIGTKEVTSAKNPAAREPGFLSFINDNSNRSSDQRRSRRFDQVLDDAEFGRVEDDEILGDYCAPIQCNEDDDGPDFSRMTKNQLTEQSSSNAGNKKGQDIRKRFQIERPKGASSAIAGNLISPGSANSHNTVSTDMSLNNPLAESLTAEMLLRQQLVEQSIQSAKKQQKLLELPKELQFSSDDSDDESGDLAGFTVIVNSKKTVKYVPDQERDPDDAKIGYNYDWHESIKREKHLIIEAPRPIVSTLKA